MKRLFKAMENFIIMKDEALLNYKKSQLEQILNTGAEDLRVKFDQLPTDYDLMTLYHMYEEVMA